MGSEKKRRERQRERKSNSEQAKAPRGISDSSTACSSNFHRNILPATDCYFEMVVKFSSVAHQIHAIQN